MATPFLGEIKIVSFGYAPKGWAFCDGQMLPINQNQALFSLFGTAYGGNGQTTFALPDLRGRCAVYMDGTYTLGQKGGETQHTLVGAEMPAPHNHVSNGTSNPGTSNTPTGMVLANPGLNLYATPNPVQGTATAVSSIGGQPHQNMSPYLVVGFMVALQGIFPSRN